MLRALNLNVHVVNRVVLHKKNFAKMNPAKKRIGLKDYIGKHLHVLNDFVFISQKALYVSNEK
jgi:hypothetical protein